MMLMRFARVFYFGKIIVGKRKNAFVTILKPFSSIREMNLSTQTFRISSKLSYRTIHNDIKIDSTPQPSTRMMWLEDNTSLDILKIYKSIHRNLEVPRQYIVPAEAAWPAEFHGYPLGKKVTTIRLKARYISDKFKSELNALGFIWKLAEYRFQKVDQALQTYKKLHGHLQVPQAFIVPSDSSEWPEELWGHKLGMVVNNIRFRNLYAAKRKYFEKMGFKYSPTYGSYDFASIKKSIEVYKKRHRTFYVSRKYVIPADDMDYPASMRGANLGQIVSNIINKNYYSDHHEELEKMGMSLLPLQFNRYYQAMQCYKKKYGQLTNVPHSYVIPKGSKEFPTHLWGLKLGGKLCDIRLKGIFKQHHDRLRELGVPLPNENSTENDTLTKHKLTALDTTLSDNEPVDCVDITGLTLQPSNGAKWFGDNTFLDILKIYKSIHRNLEVPRQYIVPAEAAWPAEFHGYPLGKKVTTIRLKARYISDKFKSELNALGFIWKLAEYRFQKAVQALQTYKKLHGHLQVPQAFIVPSDSSEWPEELWGYKLGGTVLNIRCHSLYAAKRKYLENIGFVYEKAPRRVNDFDCIKKSIEVYKKKYGTFQIPYNYIIPTDDKDFPERIRGTKFGHIVYSVIHNNQWSKHHEDLEKMGMSLLQKKKLL